MILSVISYGDETQKVSLTLIIGRQKISFLKQLNSSQAESAFMKQRAPGNSFCLHNEPTFDLFSTTTILFQSTNIRSN